MSPNRLEFDRTIEELKSEQPTSAQRARALAAVLSSKGTSRTIPGLVATVAVVVALLLILAPTRASGLAWADVLQRTQQATDLHITYFDATGRVTGEQWRSGPYWAHWVKDKTGRLVSEVRSGPSNLYVFTRRDLPSPNATHYATLWNRSRRSLAATSKFMGPPRTIDELLGDGKAKQLGKEEVRVGQATVQRFSLQMPQGTSIVVDADPKSGRIMTVRLPGGESQRFEYPPSLDPKVFSFRARLTPEVPVLDLRGKEEPRKLPPYMPVPIASKGGILLREVSISADGDLYVFWTGYLSTKPARRPKVIGVKTGKTLWLGYYNDGIHPVQGPPEERLLCYRVELAEKIGARLTIRIPTASSYVEFKGVAVKRLRPLAE